MDTDADFWKDVAEHERQAARRYAAQNVAMHRDGMAALQHMNACHKEAEWLRAELARLREEARWIPCSERWPEKHTLVMVYRNGVGVGFIGSRGWMVGDRWVDDWDSVTHWRPLPAPPAETE